jgi:hypothetical protein
MAGKTGQLVIAVLLIGSGCTTHRVSPHGFFGDRDQVAPSVSLHGLFGSTGDIDQVRELLPAPGEQTPLPPFWHREVPLEGISDGHTPLYLDSVSQTGQDDQCKKGLECSTLAFYAGHGSIDHWDVPNDRVPLNQVKVGDGLLRYFWLHSCNVLAHGPKVGIDFSQPHRWSGSPGDVDVFTRWTDSFRPGLRMACGGSSLLGSVLVGEIWDHLFGAERSVPDAFVLGVAQPKLKQVPVCLARGGQHPNSSALKDRTLEPDGVRDNGWLHFQTPVPCKVEFQGFKLIVTCGSEDAAPLDAQMPSTTPEIEALPRVKTEPMPPPVPPAEGRRPLGFVPLPGSRAKYHPDSGAVVLIKRRDRYTRLEPCGKVTTWEVDPWALLRQRGLKLDLLPSASSNAIRRFSDATLTATEMRVESRQDGAPIRERKCWVRSLFIRFDTEIPIGTINLPIFGPGVILEIPRGEELNLVSFSAPNRELTVLTGLFDGIKPSDAAKTEAQQQLQLDPEIYPISAAQAILGYEEAPLQCRQEFLRPTYEIRFSPSTPEFPTVIVRRDARRDSREPSWECRGWDDDG